MRLGVFGGSFDPVHNGHLFVAEAVREACALDRVLFVPTREGKHYRDGAMNASAEQRAQMIRLAIAANVAFALDESDLGADATGYTADLLPRLQARYPGAALSFVVGGDSLVRSRWKRLEEVVDIVEALVAAPREGARARPADGRRVGDADPRTASRRQDRPLPGPGARVSLHRRTRVIRGVRTDDALAADKTLGGVSARELAETYGTPLFVIDLDELDLEIDRFERAFAPHGIAVGYAGKAFLCSALAEHLAATPLRLDVCSLGELVTAERGGLPAARLYFHGCGKTGDELRAIVEHRVAFDVIDNREELERLAALASADDPIEVMLRVNTGIEAHTHAFVRTGGEPLQLFA